MLHKSALCQMIAIGDQYSDIESVQAEVNSMMATTMNALPPLLGHMATHTSRLHTSLQCTGHKLQSYVPATYTHACKQGGSLIDKVVCLVDRSTVSRMLHFCI
jgi:hypothetical protein